MFNEKNEEYSKKQAKNIEVWQSPKYIEAKEKALELIKGKKYDLTEGDFWILMNETKTGKMGYTGLIISHNGCLKINDKLENKIKPSCFSVKENGYNGSLIYTYCDDEIYEVGEVNSKNCTNDYPYAMAFKRCFDRVVLKKCKLAYAGIYSDSEAEEFTRPDAEDDYKEATLDKKQIDALDLAIKNNGVQEETALNIYKKYGYNSINEIKLKDYMNIVNDFKDLIGG